ncbi:SGNH/GDSL hydrolase family protein [Flammeovirga sp. SubArs3]|uniref:SGNH/GDSL hydrolase family protein n=1 Tax=Flammeovirga sp. SubArs3 TaxID=2995316 RepID=UPI00248BC19B|nr:SGNH/GDSL hydrolase family protein [Flammeovirga sp. SubArs3]
MENIYIQGRVEQSNKQIKIFWPGTILTFKINGGPLKVQLSDDLGESRYSIIVDGKEIEDIQPTENKEWYVLYAPKDKKDHTVELHRKNDFSKGTSTLYAVVCDGDLDEIKPNKKHIEYYGNSISVGYANEDTTGNDDSYFTNNYWAYTSQTSRALNTEQTIIARSGIGLMVSWFDLIMPELYDRLNPNDKKSKWDFSKKIPDLVVINLMQNDKWLMQNPDNENFLKRIGRRQLEGEEIIEKYSQFLQGIRLKYPNTPIICTLGCMDISSKSSVFPEYVKSAIHYMRDDQIYYLEYPFLAKLVHPSVEMHTKMSQYLVEFIRKHQLI